MGWQERRFRRYPEGLMSILGRASALLLAALVWTWGLCPCAMARALREAAQPATADASDPRCGEEGCCCCPEGEEDGPGCPHGGETPGKDCPHCLAAGCGRPIVADGDPVSLPEAASIGFAPLTPAGAPIELPSARAEVSPVPAGPPGDPSVHLETVVLRN
jgi:hypothetical protein